MDITTLLIIVLIVLLLGGGWCGRGRWYRSRIAFAANPLLAPVTITAFVLPFISSYL
ncbi:hypothetical protein [Sinorhizobium meliloti]|uniref:hypothetical protein n=1 Tax=Rhizobium meliloti TaxID=382 RepID=UPI0013156EA3|nr:hypothetical protein [Sinorhizobium meliloti]QND28139.1 hypothetical protein HB773_17930 [Sinorhizobium meliloti]WQP11057.1 hypothetical protein U8C30_13110 [Sinorhizobium meliloti]WQP24520.1 hypothetical protein U8C43_13070 [Sinorhizobium meliloti]